MTRRLRGDNHADAVLTVGTIVVICVPYLLSPIRARLLGTTGRGDFAFFQAVLTVAGAFAASGLRLAFYESGIDDVDRRRLALVRPVLTSTAAGAVVLGVGVGIAATQLGSVATAVALAVCVLLPPGYALIQVEIAAAQQADDRRFVFGANASTALADFALNLVLFVTRTFSLATALAATLLAEAARVVAAVARRARTDEQRSVRPDREASARFSSASRRNAALTIVPVLCTNLDVFIWGAFLPTSVIGLYAISKMGYGFFLVLGGTTEGRALRRFAVGGSRAYARGVLLPAVGVFVLASAAGAILVPVVFGDEFRAAATAFPVACLGGLFAFLFVSLSAVAAASGALSVARRAPALLLGAVVVMSLVVGCLHITDVIVLTAGLAATQLFGVLAVCGFMWRDGRSARRLLAARPEADELVLR